MTDKKNGKSIITGRKSSLSKKTKEKEKKKKKNRKKISDEMKAKWINSILSGPTTISMSAVAGMSDEMTEAISNVPINMQKFVSAKSKK